MTDLTAITTPFGLLDEATREALKAHGGPYEWWHSVSWRDFGDETPGWLGNVVYRVKPQPPKPREWWLTGGCAWDTLDEAMRALNGNGVPVLVREVLP